MIDIVITRPRISRYFSYKTILVVKSGLVNYSICFADDLTNEQVEDFVKELFSGKQYYLHDEKLKYETKGGVA